MPPLVFTVDRWQGTAYASGLTGVMCQLIMLENFDILDGMLGACQTVVSTLCPLTFHVYGLGGPSALTFHVPNLQDTRKGEVPNG